MNGRARLPHRFRLSSRIADCGHLYGQNCIVCQESFTRLVIFAIAYAWSSQQNKLKISLAIRPLAVAKRSYLYRDSTHEANRENEFPIRHSVS